MQKQEMDNILEMTNTFEIATGIKCKYIELEGNSAYAPTTCSNPFCRALHELIHHDFLCKDLSLHAYTQAKRFGIPYIYYCNIGLVHIITPIEKEDGKKRALLCGPLLISDPYEYLFEEIAIKYKISASDIQYLLKVLDEIGMIEPHRVTAISKLVEIVANSASSDMGKLNTKIRNEVQKQQGKLHEYLTEQRQSTPKAYSMQKEKQLIATIKDCDIENAKEMLNSILGDLFVIAASDMDTIKTRVLELIVLLSRGAVEAGVSTDEIFGLNGQYIKQILEDETIDALYFSLNELLIRFVDSVFVYRDMRHVDSIRKAIHYIQQNYMNKITLEEIASYIHVSPTYFSKIFKEETGTNFAMYLNETRIEGAKHLLSSDEASLVEIAYLVGFEDQSYFSRVFKKYTGMTPKKYKELKSE